MLKHSDQVMIDHQRELRNLRDKIDNEISRVESEFTKYATIDKLKEVDHKFLKFAKNDYVIELNAKLELIKVDISHLAKVEYVTEQIDALTHDVKEAINSFVSIQVIEEQFGIYEAKLKKIRKEFKEEIDEFLKLEENIEEIESKLK